MHTGASSRLCTYSSQSPFRGLTPEDPISKQTWLPWIHSEWLPSGLGLGMDPPHRQNLPLGELSPCRLTAGPRASVPAFQLRSYKLRRSDLGPPAFDELHDLLDLQLGEVEVVCQDVLTELHKDAAIDAFSGKEAHHVL